VDVSNRAARFPGRDAAVWGVRVGRTLWSQKSQRWRRPVKIVIDLTSSTTQWHSLLQLRVACGVDALNTFVHRRGTGTRFLRSYCHGVRFPRPVLVPASTGRQLHWSCVATGALMFKRRIPDCAGQVAWELDASNGIPPPSVAIAAWAARVGAISTPGCAQERKDRPRDSIAGSTTAVTARLISASRPLWLAFCQIEPARIKPAGEIVGSCHMRPSSVDEKRLIVMRWKQCSLVLHHGGGEGGGGGGGWGGAGAGRAAGSLAESCVDVADSICVTGVFFFAAGGDGDFAMPTPALSGGALRFLRILAAAAFPLRYVADSAEPSLAVS